MVDRTLPTLNATAVPADNSIFLIRRNGQTEDEKVTGADLKSYFSNAPAISGGTADNMVIGGTTPAVGTFTTLSANTIDTGQGAVECYAMDQAVRTTDAVTFSNLSLTTDLAVTHGGTGASTASGARTNLGLVIGTNVQAQDAGLQSIAGLTTAANTGIYTTGSDTYATYSLTAGGRALGAATGTADTFPYFSALNTVASASITAAGRALIDDADASAQRATLGLVIGTNVQAQDAGLQSIAGLTTAADRMIYTTASDTYAVTTLTSFARTLLDDSSASTARTTLGLGTIATQAASNVAITGGSVTGITDIAVADGGTGASTAGGARTNLGLGTIATQAANNVSITGGSISGITDIAIVDGGTGASTASGARTNLDVYSTSEVDALIPAAPSGWEFVDSLDISGITATSTIDDFLNSFADGYDYLLSIHHLSVASTGGAAIRFTDDGTSTGLHSSANHRGAQVYVTSAGGNGQDTTTTATEVSICANQTLSASANRSLSGELLFHNPASGSGYVGVHLETSFFNSGDVYYTDRGDYVIFDGTFLSATGFRLFSAVNFDEGILTLHRKKLTA